MTEWYKNYEKGKPFYTISSLDVVQKNYFAGWCAFELYNGEIKEDILSVDGGSRRADAPTDMRRKFPPFPEEDLPDVMLKLKEFNESRARIQLAKAEEVVIAKQKQLDDAPNWTPKVIDFKDNDPYPYDDPELGRFDDEMYKEVHLA